MASERAKYKDVVKLSGARQIKREIGLWRTYGKRWQLIFYKRLQPIPGVNGNTLVCRHPAQQLRKPGAGCSAATVAQMRVRSCEGCGTVSVQGGQHFTAVQQHVQVQRARGITGKAARGQHPAL